MENPGTAQAYWFSAKVFENGEHANKIRDRGAPTEGPQGSAAPNPWGCRNDAGRAPRVFPRDEEVDALYQQVFRGCLTDMMKDNRLITQCAQYIFVIRHLERIADNACKIAEKVVYMATGKRRLNGAYKLPE